MPRRIEDHRRLISLGRRVSRTAVDSGHRAHESAWRLPQQAVHDLREWVDVQRMLPREL